MAAKPRRFLGVGASTAQALRLTPEAVKRYCLSPVPYAEPSAALRLKLRRAIDKEGLYAFSKRAGAQPSTVQRLAHAAGKTHRKTIDRVQAALNK